MIGPAGSGQRRSAAGQRDKVAVGAYLHVSLAGSFDDSA
jgi:hypothetical protein